MTNHVQLKTRFVHKTAVEFHVSEINKVASEKYAGLGKLKMLVPHTLTSNYRNPNELHSAMEAKLIEELRNYGSLALSYFTNYAGEKEIPTNYLREGVDAFLRTIDFKFYIDSVEGISTFKQMKKHVDENPKYEEVLMNLITDILLENQDTIVKYANNKKLAAEQASKLKSKAPAETVNEIVSVTLDMSHMTEPLKFEVITGPSARDPENFSTPHQRLMEAFQSFFSGKATEWLKNASCGSMNHDARKTYMQQVIDLEDLEKVLRSEEARYFISGRVTLPWHTREISRNEYDALLKNMHALLYRKNAIKFDELFSYWQMYNGTRHPDGVMH